MTKEQEVMVNQRINDRCKEFGENFRSLFKEMVNNVDIPNNLLNSEDIGNYIVNNAPDSLMLRACFLLHFNKANGMF